jgi:tetratricopeptide (TPR) repeat protein
VRTSLRIPGPIFPAAISDGARLSPGARATICWSGRRGRSCTTLPSIRARPATLPAAAKRCWIHSRRNWRISTAGWPPSGLSSSELQKLGSLGYVGLQRSAAHDASAPAGSDPKDEIAVANRVQSALAALSAGRPAQALPVLERAAATPPAIYLALYGLGLAQIANKDYARAIEPLHQAIALRPDSALAHYAMGVAASHTGNWNTAATHLEIAVARLSESAQAHEILGEAYTHLGRKSDAAREQSRAAQLRSQYP